MEESYTLYCDLSSLNKIRYPEASWITWKQGADRIQNFTIIDGNTDCDGFISNSVKDSGLYSCVTGNIIGSSNTSDNIDIHVEGISCLTNFLHVTLFHFNMITIIKKNMRSPF